MRLAITIYPIEIKQDKVFGGTRWRWWIKNGPQMIARSKEEGHPTAESAMKCIETLRYSLGTVDILIEK